MGWGQEVKGFVVIFWNFGVFFRLMDNKRHLISLCRHTLDSNGKEHSLQGFLRFIFEWNFHSRRENKRKMYIDTYRYIIYIMCTHFEHDIIQRKIDSVQAFALVSPLSLNELHDAGAASLFYVETRLSRFVFRCHRGDLKPSQAFFLFLGLSFNTQKKLSFFPSSLSSSMRTFLFFLSFLFFFSIFLFLPTTTKKLFLLAFSLFLSFPLTLALIFPVWILFYSFWLGKSFFYFSSFKLFSRQKKTLIFFNKLFLFLLFFVEFYLGTGLR